MIRKSSKMSVRLVVFMMAMVMTFYGGVAWAQDSKEKKAEDKSFEDLSEDELYELSLEELLNLEITVGSKTAERLSDAAGVVSVVTKDELQRFGGLTLRDILERVPSLTATSSYFTDRYMMASRGDQIKINSGHILVLINGRPTREIVEGGISSDIYASFPVNIIERIEVIRGPGSVLYGSNAFSAVINVVTEDVEESNLEVTGIGGASGGAGALGNFKLDLGNLKIAGAGRYMKKADFETTYSAFNFFDPANPIVSDVSIPDEAIGTYVDLDYKNLRFMSSYNDYTSTAFSFGAEDVSWTKNFNDLGYSFKVGDRWDMDVNLTYNYATLNTGGMLGLERKSNDVVAEWSNKYKLTERSKVIVGGLYNYIKGTEEALVEDVPTIVSDADRGAYALYGQVDYWVVESLKLIGGFQANKVENIDLDIVPRAGLIWYPVKDINLKALYGQAFRAASIDEFSLDYPGFSGNPNIEPEKVSTIDIGANYNGENVQAGINYFRNNQSNIITPGFSADSMYMYLNRGKVKFQGVEFEAKYYINRNLFLMGSMLYQENEQDTSKNVTPIANFSAKGGISYVWDKGITASLFNVYNGKPDDVYTNQMLNPKAGSYNMLNMYLDFDIVELFNINIRQDISFFVQGNNMLNKEVWLPDWGGTYVESIPVNQGRTVYLGLNVSLK